jgi:5-methylthioadenosine/S-adenosylhomocysteine deaminase
MIDLLIVNGTIVTVNQKREILQDGAIAIEGSKIIEIGPSKVLQEKYTNVKRIIDATGKAIFPGLINTHNHLFQTLLKGLGDDKVLSDWLAEMTFPSSVHLLPEDTYAGAMLGCLDGLHSGTTTMVDYMYPHPRPELSDGVIQAFRELGIRGIFGRGFMDTGEEFGVQRGIMQDVETIEKDARRLFDKYHGTENGKIKIWLAPAAVWSNSKESLEMTKRLADEYKTGMMHRNSFSSQLGVKYK